jgi:hypothetical protein
MIHALGPDAVVFRPYELIHPGMAVVIVTDRKTVRWASSLQNRARVWTSMPTAAQSRRARPDPDGDVRHYKPSSLISSFGVVWLGEHGERRTLQEVYVTVWRALVRYPAGEPMAR